MTTVYHATPSMFTSLRAGSWVSTTLAEACLHLLMKNVKTGQHVDRLRGFVITFPDCPDDALESIAELGETINLVTRRDLHIPGPESFIPLDKAVGSLPLNQQSIFYADDIVDLKPFLSD